MHFTFHPRRKSGLWLTSRKPLLIICMSELGPSPFWTVHREKILSTSRNSETNTQCMYELRKLLKELNESGETSRLFLSILKVRKDFELFGRFY